MVIEKINKISSDQIYGEKAIFVVDKTLVEDGESTHFDGRIFIVKFDTAGNEEVCDVYDVSGTGDDDGVLEYSWKYDLTLPVEDEPGFPKWNHLIKDINRSKHIFLLGECGPSPIAMGDVWKSLKNQEE